MTIDCVFQLELSLEASKFIVKSAQYCIYSAPSVYCPPVFSPIAKILVCPDFLH